MAPSHVFAHFSEKKGVKCYVDPLLRPLRSGPPLHGNSTSRCWTHVVEPVQAEGRLDHGLPLAVVGRGSGPSRATDPSDSYGVRFNNISADLVSQLIQFSPDGRPLHTPARVRSTVSTRADSSKCDVPLPQALECNRSLNLRIRSSEWISDARKALTSTSMIICDGTFSVENLTSFQYFASGTCRYFLNSWHVGCCAS